LFSIFCPQNIHNTRITSSRKSLLLNTLRDSTQSILFKADMSKVFRTKDLSVLKQVPGPLIFKGPCCGPQAVHYHGCIAQAGIRSAGG
jgi:hypothetical protein